MKPQFERAALALVIVIAAALRLCHVDFGLPALNDPDEPLFVMTAVDMLRDGRLNPGWFGHPATMLFYALALVFLFVGLAGTALGRWSSVDGFVTTVYADPAIAFLPMRVFIVLCGVLCVYLTYRIGRRALGPWAGLLAAAILAVNGLHVEYSQIIRTDMLASVFMLASTLFAMRAAETGLARNYVLAGVMAGLAAVTKWPALLIVVNAVIAAAIRWPRGRGSALMIPTPLLAAAGALITASPFLILDFPTVLSDLGGEARPLHLGATGGSPIHNLWWYATHVFVGSFGLAGTVAALVGFAVSPFRARLLAVAAIPGALVFLVGISTQALVWERWAVPLLPFAALAIALAVREILARLHGGPRHVAAGLLLVALGAPALHTTVIRTTMRANDTRQVATAWVRSNVPATASILLEHAAFDLLDRPGAVLFPLGSAGCVDVRQALATRPRYHKVNALRTNRAIVDIGHLDRDALTGCRADIAILTHFARYQAEADRFPAQLANYRALMRNGRVVATIAPITGTRGGPVVHVVRTCGKPSSECPALR